jgi:hypothetical protein
MTRPEHSKKCSRRGGPQHLLNRTISLMAGNINNPGCDMSRASNSGNKGDFGHVN